MKDARKPGRHDTWTRRLTAKLFRQDDAAAARHGWQIEIGPSGRSRIYRDPRFDLFASCAACGGVGAECLECAGSGRVVTSREVGQRP